MRIAQLVPSQEGSMAVLWDQEARKPTVSYMEALTIALLEDENGDQWVSPMIDAEGEGLQAAIEMPNYLGMYGPNAEEDDDYWVEKAREARTEAKAAKKKQTRTSKTVEQPDDDDEGDDDDDDDEDDDEDEDEDEDEGTEVRSRGAR